MNYAPYQPYQPPAQTYAGYPRSGERGPAAWTNWVYLGAAFLSVLGFATGIALMIVAGTGGVEALAGLGVMVFMSSFLFFFVKFALRLVWLHGCWSWVPPEYRYTAGNKAVTPGTAVGFLFIPYFNLYWTFIAYVGLCSALERLCQRYRTIARPPTTIAICACIAELLPGLNMTVAPFLWFFFMKTFDDITAEIEDARSRENPDGNAQQGYGQAYPAGFGPPQQQAYNRGY